MDYYNKQKFKNLILSIIFIIAVVIQFYGQKISSYKGLGIQFISLGLVLVILFLYNRRFK